jgi:Domain of unknown function (DUF4410)
MKNAMVSFVVLAVLTATLLAADKADPAIKGKYHSLEIAQFTVKPGVGFPQDYMSKMQADLLNEIANKHKFDQVFTVENKPMSHTALLLRLEGEIIEYKAGNQAMRYMVGFGAGKTKVVAHVKFIDSKSNEVIFEDNVDGKVIMGLLGGSSPGATRGLAKEVASKASDRLF